MNAEEHSTGNNMTTANNTESPIEGWHRLTLPAHDLEVAERFYVGRLGAKLERKFNREAFLRFQPERVVDAEADNSPLYLSLSLGDGPERDLFLQKGRTRPVPAAHPHFAVWVDRDHFDASVRRLRAAPVPNDSLRRLGPQGQASVYLADSVGNPLELVTTGYNVIVIDGPPDVSKRGW